MLWCYFSAGDRKPRDFCFCQVMFWPEFLVVISPQVHSKPADCVDVVLQVTVFATWDKSCDRPSVLQLWLWNVLGKRKLHWSHQCMFLFSGPFFFFLCSFSASAKRSISILSVAQNRFSERKQQPDSTTPAQQTCLCLTCGLLLSKVYVLVVHVGGTSWIHLKTNSNVGLEHKLVFFV